MFWSGPDHFGQVQTILVILDEINDLLNVKNRKKGEKNKRKKKNLVRFKLDSSEVIFIIWTSPKLFGPNHFGHFGRNK